MMVSVNGLDVCTRRVGEVLRGIAARDFGSMNVDAVLVAWHDWSEAFLFHSALAFDQGGPLRIGPMFPFVLPGDPWLLPPYPEYEWYEGKRYGNGWKHLASSYNILEDQFPGRLVMTGKEFELWRKGSTAVKRLLAVIDDEETNVRENILAR